MTPLLLHTTIEPMGAAGGFVLTDDQVSQLGGGKRAAVLVRVGDRTARLRVAVMGGCNLIGLSKANRTLLGVEIGDIVDAEISLDDTPRVVTVPEDLTVALDAEPDLKARFEALAFTHQREFVEWIDEAKRSDTRRKRVDATVDMIRQRKTRS